MLHKVNYTSTGSVNTVDDQACLVDMEREEPKFFQNTHGKRETYTVHRGCLIVRNTPRHSLTGRPTRMTAIYLFYPKEHVGSDKNSYSGLSNLAGFSPSSVASAKRLIDQVLESGKYSYGKIGE